MFFLYKFGIVNVVGDNMYRIAICDGDEKTVTMISEIVSIVSEKLDEDVQIFTYTDGKEMYNSHIRFNLMFLDVELPGINGIDIARKTRLIDHRVQIVFVTDHQSYWKKAYRVHAFEFIQKPFSIIDIQHVITDYFKMMNNQKSDVLKLKKLNNVELLIPSDEVIYISCGAKKRQVIVITKDNEYVCKGVISEIYCELNNLEFFMPHRSHIINLSNIKSYKRNDKILMINDDEIPLSKGRTSEFEEKYIRLLRDRVSI